jgi:hypothetical protein
LKVKIRKKKKKRLVIVNYFFLFMNESYFVFFFFPFFFFFFFLLLLSLFEKKMNYSSVAQLFVSANTSSDHVDERLLDLLFDLLLDTPHAFGTSTAATGAATPTVREPLIAKSAVLPVLMSVVTNALQRGHESVAVLAVERLAVLLRDSRNLAAAFEAVQFDWLHFLLDAVRTDDAAADTPLVAALLALVEAFAASTMNVAHLRRFMRLVAACRSASLRALLVARLERIGAPKAGPLAYFDCDGVTSGIKLSRLAKFPSNGYSFCLWVSLAALADARRPHHPRLFSFLCADTAGIEAVFVGSKLALRVRQSGGRTEEVLCNYTFEAQTWYHLVVTHQYHLVGKSIITLYVNGARDCAVPLRYPSDINKRPLTHVCICTNDRVDEAQIFTMPLAARLGDCVLYADVLTANDVRAQYECGPDRLFALHGKHDNVAADVAVPLQGGTATTKAPSSDGTGVAAAAAAANAPQLRSTSLKPIFAYSARACRGSACLLTLPPDFSQLVDLIELGNAIAANDGVDPPASSRKSSGPPEQIIVAGSFLSDGAATRLRATRLIRTLDVKNTLHCIGGVSALLPLLTSDENCAGALRLIVTMIDGNIRNQADLVRCAGPAIMAMLLRDRAVTAITDTLLTGVQSLYATAQLPQLKRRLLEDLLFEYAAWIAAPFAVQRQLLQTLQERAVASIAYFRSTIEVPFMLDILQRFLWFRQPSLSAAALGFDPARRSLSHQEVAELRSMLLTLLMWVLGGHGTLNAILPDSLQAPAELGRQQSVASGVTRRQTVTGTDRPLMASGSSNNPFSKAREVGITQEMRLPPPTTAQLRHGIEALLKYVHVAEDRTAITDVLWLIVRLMHDTDSAMAVIEGMSGVPQCFVALLDVDSPAVRMAALRAIGVFLSRLSPRARERFTAEFGLTFIVDKLGAFTVDERAYVGVLLLLIGDGGVSCDWPVLSDATTLVNPTCVIALLHLLSLADKLELVRNALKDLSALASRPANSDAIAALSCWQLWILELPLRVRSLAADGSNDLDSLFDLTTTLLSTVLCRAVRAHADGWRHVEDTLEYVRYLAGSNTQLRGAAVTRQILFKLLRGLEADIQQLMSANDVEGAVQLGRNIAYIAVLVEQHALGNGALTIGDESEDRPIAAPAVDEAAAAATAPAVPERATTPSIWRDFALCAKLLDLLDWVLVPPIYSAALDEEVMSALNGPQAAVAGGGGTSSVPTTLPRPTDPDAPPASAPAPLPAGYTSLTLFHLQLSLMVHVLEHASTVYGTSDVAGKQAPLRELHALLHAGASAQEMSSALWSRLSDQLRDKLAQTMAPLKALQRLYDKCTQRLRALLRQATMALPTAANEARLVQLAHVIGRAIGKSADENSAVGLELLPLFRDLLTHRSLAYLEPDLILAGIVEQQQRVRDQNASTSPPPVAATAAFVSTTPAVVLPAAVEAPPANDNPKRLSSFSAMARARASSAQPASSVRSSGSLSGSSSGATSPRGPASDDNSAGSNSSGGTSVVDARNDAMTELARRMAAMLTHSATEAANSSARRMQLVAPHRTARRSALRAQVAGNVDRWRVDSVRRHTAIVSAGAAYHQQACADAAATTALLAARRQLAIDGVRHWWTKRVMRQLTHARAAWFVPTEQSAEHWKLDMAQNHIGMRLRLRRNYTFDQHENATATYRKQQFEGQAATGSELSSKADAALNDQLRMSQWKFGEGTAAAVASVGVAGGSGSKDDDEGGDAAESAKEEASSPSLMRNASFLKEAGRSDGDGEWTVVDDNASTSSQSGSLPSVSGEPPLDDERLLVQMVASDRERSVFSTNDVEFVTLHTSVRGRIDVTNVSLYFYAETNEGADGHEPDNSRKTRRWPLAALKSVTRRRYMLKETAVEMLFDTRRSYMLNFESVQVRRRFVKALAATATCEIDTKERSHVDELKLQL